MSLYSGSCKFAGCVRGDCVAPILVSRMVRLVHRNRAFGLAFPLLLLCGRVMVRVHGVC